MTFPVQVSEPETEPITLEEAKAQLRITDDNSDDYIETVCIPSARQFFEEYTGRSLIARPWKLTLADWPPFKWVDRRSVSRIELARSPLVSVESVKYYPADGTAQATLSSSDYHVVSSEEPACIELVSTETWPDLADRPDAVEVLFTAGVTDADDVPPLQKHGVRLLTVHFFENGAPVPISIGGNAITLPFSLQAILDSQRVGGMIA